MFLSRFRVRGYKCLEDVDLPLTPFHAIVGPNDCGKSCLLEAISALYGRLKTPPAQWFPAAASPRDWLAHGSKAPTIDLAGQWSQRLPPDGRPALAAGYGFSVVVPAIGQSLAVTDQWVRPRATSDPRAGLTHKAFAFPHGSDAASAEDRVVQSTFRDVVQSVLQPAPVYRLQPGRLAEPVEMDDCKEKGRFEGDGYGLAALLKEIAGHHAERFVEIEAAFCRAVPQYRSISLRMEERKSTKRSRGGKSTLEPPCACAVELETPSGRSVSAREVSPGAMLLLAMATLARLPEPPTLLLIENPEQGIYPPRLADVMEPLRNVTQWSAGRRATQVIITTHSSLIQSFFQPHETTMLSRPEEHPDGPVVTRPL